MKLVQEGEHIALRQINPDVSKEQFGTVELSKIIKNMFKILSQENDGVALAAPQVGLPMRIFVVAPNLAGISVDAPLVYINPKIEKFSKEKKNMEEGCFSVRWLYGEVQRHTKVNIVAYDEFGNIFKRGAGGLLAHIYQHEIEHLDGILFIDKAKNIQRLDDDTVLKIKSKNKK